MIHSTDRGGQTERFDTSSPTVAQAMEPGTVKRPEGRFQSARDLAFALANSASASGRADLATVTETERRRSFSA